MTVEVHPFLEVISGQTVRRILVQEHWCSGELSDPVNVLFAELDAERWLRFFFDAGVFFWSTVQSPTLPESTRKHRYALTDLGWSGTATHADLAESFEAANLTIYFTDGRMLQLNNAQDRSWIGEAGNDR